MNNNAAQCKPNTSTGSAGSSTATEIKITAKDLCLPENNLDQGALGSLLGTVYFWAGIIAVIVIVVGGIRYTTSNGDPANVKNAKNTILYAVVGLVVIIMAAGITQFVTRQVAPASGNGNTNQQGTTGNPVTPSN
jgi:hypothetical protein